MSRIVGTGICGPAEAGRYLKATLEDLGRLCDDVVILGNNTGKKEAELIKSFGFSFVEDDREWGLDQPKIKEDFIRSFIAPLEPDWVLMLDMDETFDPSFTRQELDALVSGVHDVCWRFWCVELWDKEEQHRSDFLFEVTRLWKFFPNKLAWNPQPLHCGNAPEWNNSWASSAGIPLYHWGLMEKAERDRRVARYRKYDPTARWLDPLWYMALEAKNPPLEPVSALRLPETRFRSKPVRGSEIEPMSSKRWSFRNPHGVIVSIDTATDKRAEEHARQLSKNPRFSLISVEEGPPEPTRVRTSSLKEVPVEPDPFECLTCGFVAKNEAGLKVHATRSHKV